MTTDSATISHRFDLQRIIDCFECCNTEKISLTHYISAYKELNKLFYQLGRLFHFVAYDIEEKLGVLEAFLQTDNKEHYETIEGMLEFETQKELLHQKHFVSGSRSLLRLHRALEFIVRFIDDIHRSSDGDKTSSIGIQGYDATLAKFHPWLIRKTVHLALYSLPYRRELLEDLAGDLTQEERDKRMTATVKIGTEVYVKVQKMYEDRKLLDLP